jgi:hypothetical protein
MSDAKKEALKAAKLLLTAPSIGAVGLPPGVNVVTNATAVARFPLPLTVVSAVITAVGIIATFRGHRIIGVGLMVFGGVGLGAAAAAPELTAQINKAGLGQ